MALLAVESDLKRIILRDSRQFSRKQLRPDWIGCSLGERAFVARSDEIRGIRVHHSENGIFLFLNILAAGHCWVIALRIAIHLEGSARICSRIIFDHPESKAAIIHDDLIFAPIGKRVVFGGRFRRKKVANDDVLSVSPHSDELDSIPDLVGDDGINNGVAPLIGGLGLL